MRRDRAQTRSPYENRQTVAEESAISQLDADLMERGDL